VSTLTACSAPLTYINRHSADAQYKQVSAATLKGYTPAEWPDLEAARHAGCERGEHSHREAVAPSKKAIGARAHAFSSPAVPTSTMAPATPPTHRAASPPVAALRTVIIDSCTPSPTLAPSPTQAAHVVPAGRRAYAVRSQGQGDVFDEYEPACNYYHHLQHLGEHPVLGIRNSLTAAVCFVEEGGRGPASAVLREQWIHEELRARTAASSSVSSSASDLEESELDLSGSEVGVAAAGVF
jgi:hypothetical protein